MEDSNGASCGFEGNSDVYGVGIRVGFYTQALAAWYANFFIASEARTLQTTNRLFLLAISVVAIWYAASPDSGRYAIELWCMCLFAGCIKVVSQQRRTRYSSSYVPFNLTQMASTRLFDLSAASFANWFWWQGIEQLQPTPCGTYIFFFARLDMYGPFGIFVKVVCAIWAAFALLQATGCIHYMKLKFRHRGTKQSFVLTMKMLEAQIPGFKRPLNVEDKSTSSSSLINSISKHRENPAAVSARTVSSQDSQASTLVATSLPKDILKAEKYLQFIFDFSKAQPETEEADVKKSTLLSELRILLVFFWTHPHLRSIWDVLASHHEAIRGRPADMFTLVSRMIQLDTEGQTPDFRMLRIASDIHLSHLPLLIDQGWMLQAGISLSSIIWMVVGVELTIVWNRITGLDNIFTVGQLLPLIIGIGGLLQVLWRKWRALSRNIREEEEKLKPTEYEHAFVTYLAWKRMQEATLN